MLRVVPLSSSSTTDWSDTNTAISPRGGCSTSAGDSFLGPSSGKMLTSSSTSKWQQEPPARRKHRRSLRSEPSEPATPTARPPFHWSQCRTWLSRCQQPTGLDRSRRRQPRSDLSPSLASSTSRSSKNFLRQVPSQLQTLQVNLGYRCNQSCSHCHVDAGPWRTEMMAADQVVDSKFSST